MRRHAALLALLAVAGVLLVLRLVGDLAHNPFARVPISDAQAYWTWAGDIAHGQLIGREPFFSAPLYPYVLGLLRALGGGMLAAGLLQILLHLATAALVAHVATRLRDKRTGLLAAALYLLADDPAFQTTRLLNDALACLLAAATWAACLRLRDAPTPRRAASTGLLFGLAVLTQPALLLGVPLLASWSWRVARSLAPAVALGVAALLPVAASTAHNLAACGEPILVSAQSGVTFAGGNAHGADGTFLPIPGVSRDRVRQNQDARELVRGETDGSWSATDRAFWRRGLQFWASEPAAAGRLILRRLWWFLTGRHYGDIYVPALEADAGLQPWAWSAPLPAAWLVLPGLVALLLAVGARRAGLPELLLAGAPLLAVLLFFYSPRYRGPALPLCAAYTALAITGWRTERGAARALLLGALIAAPVFTLLNGAVGFDGLDALRAGHERLLAQCLDKDGRPDDALVHFHRAAELGDIEALAGAGDLLRRLGRRDEALAVLREAAARAPDSADAQRSLAIALAESGATGPARAAFEASLSLAPNVPETLSGLGNVLLAQGDAAGALARYDKALALQPDYAHAWANRASALIALKRLDDAVDSTARAVALDPTLLDHVTAVLRHAGASDAQLARIAPR